MKNGLIIQIENIVDFERDIKCYGLNLPKILKEDAKNVNKFLSDLLDNNALLLVVPSFEYTKINKDQLSIVLQKQGINNCKLYILNNVEKLKYINKLSALKNISNIYHYKVNNKITEALNNIDEEHYIKIKKLTPKSDISEFIDTTEKHDGLDELLGAFKKSYSKKKSILKSSSDKYTYSGSDYTFIDDGLSYYRAKNTFNKHKSSGFSKYSYVFQEDNTLYILSSFDHTKRASISESGLKGLIANNYGMVSNDIKRQINNLPASIRESLFDEIMGNFSDDQSEPKGVSESTYSNINIDNKWAVTGNSFTITSTSGTDPIPIDDIDNNDLKF